MWLEVFTACNISYWMIENLCAALTRTLYAGALGLFYSVACVHSTTIAGTGVRLF